MQLSLNYKTAGIINLQKKECSCSFFYLFKNNVFNSLFIYLLVLWFINLYHIANVQYIQKVPAAIDDE